jgi:hypothetical protein
MVRAVVREGLLCFAVFFIIFTLTHSGYDESEAPYQYMVARQILTAHALGFSEPQRGIFKVAPNGRTYASHEIGNSLFMLPYVLLNVQLERQLTPRIGQLKVRLLTRFLTASLSSVYAAAGLTLIFVLLRVFFAQTLRAALMNALILGFCSYYWTYSRSLFDGLLCATLLCAATLLLFLYGRSGDLKLLVLAFCFLGLGFISRLTMAIPIAAAFFYLGLVLRFNWKSTVRAVIIAAFVLLPFFAWQAYYNHLRTGNALISAVQTYEDNGLTGDLRTHVLGLLISPGKGVLVYAPPVLLALFCFPAFLRRYPREALYIGMIGLAWLLIHAKLGNNWHGTFGWGPKHFITIAPVVAIPFLVCGRKVFRSPAKMAFAGISLCFGFVLAVASIIGNDHYRLEFANIQGIDEHHIVWSLMESQTVDMLRSSSRNIARMFVSAPWDVVPAASAMDQHASNTVNVWLVTAYHEGVPAAVVALAAVLLLSLLICCFWFLLRTRPAGHRMSAGYQ